MLRYGSEMYLKKALAEQNTARAESIIADLRGLLDQQKDPAWAERTRKVKLLGTMVISLQT